ncbi:MAG TPA: IS66 family insertion sequence element accessory protein TnpB [Tardiphaga sp.]
MRKGMKGLASRVQDGLGRDPFAGDVIVFRGRARTLIKALRQERIGLSLYAKRLDRGRIIWPSSVDGAVALTRRRWAICWRRWTGAIRNTTAAAQGRIAPRNR